MPLGGKTRRGWGSYTVKMKGTPVLGLGIFPKDLMRVALFPDIFSVGDFPA
jgi:hypothetical protein